MKWKNSISKQLFLFFSIFIALIFTVYGLILNSQSREFFKASVKERLVSDAQTISLDINQFLDKYRGTVDTMATDTRFRSLMEEIESSETKREHPLYEDISSQFKSIKDTDENISLVFLSLNRANDLLTDDYSYDHSTDDIMRERIWYIESVKKKGETVVTNPYTDLKTGEEVITVGKVLYRGEEDLGAVALDIMVADIFSFIESYKIGDRGYSVLIREDGQIIYHPDRSILQSEYNNISHYLGDLSMEILSNGNGFLSYESEESNYLAYSDIEGTPWRILTIIPKEEALSSVDRLIFINFAILLTTILVSLAFINLLSKRISKPIVDMSSYTEEICNKFGIEVGKEQYLDREDEIGELFNNIHNMANSIEVYIGDIEEKNEKLLEEVGIRKELQAKNDMILRVFSNSTEGMFITDREGKLIYWNEKLMDIFKLSENNMKTINLVNSIKSDWLSRFYASKRNFAIKEELEFEGYTLIVNLQKIEEENTIYVLGNMEDLTDQKEKEEALFLLRNFDSLTGLHNKTYLESKIEDYIREEKFFGILIFNIERFRVINEARGYSFGNRVLVEVANGLKLESKKNDIVARMGSDEFAILKGSMASSEELYEYVMDLSKRLRDTYNIDGEEVYLNLRLGISLYPQDADNASELLKYATSALNSLKLNNQNTFQFYNRDINKQSIYRYEIENNIKAGLEKQEFELYYQPQVDIDSERVVGTEALIRWNKDGGIVSPGIFIPVAEMSKLIIPVGEWVLREGCKFGRELYDRGYNITTSINVSKIQFRRPYLPMLIGQILEEIKLPPSLLELEITESILMDNESECRALLEELDDMGIRVSIDDFGTGYSSLSYLKKLKFDKIKIDRAFIKDIPDTDDGVIAKVIVELAQNLKLDVIAEGAETLEQIEFLRENDCKKVQGYYYSKPLPRAEFLEFLDKRG